MILRFGILVERLGEHEPRHGDARLVGPAEGPPDLVERLLLVEVVRDLRAARRMQPDRLVELVHGGEERLELGPVQRLAADVGIDLHAERAELRDRALGLRGAGIGGRQRRLRDEGREALGVLGDQLGHAVVADPGELERDLGVALGHRFQRRHRQRDDLRVVGELVDHAQARVEIVDRLHRPRAPEHVLEAGADLLHALVVGGRIEMRESIDAHGVPPQSSRPLSPALAGQPYATLFPIARQRT